MTIAMRLTLSCVALAAACGDNSKDCGEGTVDVDGRCVVGELPPAVTCAAGTRFDEVTNACVIDPTACQAGTVLIRGRCQDPTADINPDLEEGAEPNGAGVGEPSVAPAGVFQLPAIGDDGIVIHGTITPQADRNADGVPEPDVDTFVVDATGPAVLEITVDGVNGLNGGFLLESAVSELDGWSRIGLNLSGDTARRRVFLPAAGRYRLAISDARSLTFPYAVIGDDTTEYFVTITQHPLTTPTPITLTGGMAEVTGFLDPLEIEFFAAPLGNATNDLVLVTSHESSMGGLVVLVEDLVAGFADEAKAIDGSSDAELAITGVQPGDNVMIVVEPKYNLATPVPFTLDVVARSTLR